MKYFYLEELLETLSTGNFDIMTGIECAKLLVSKHKLPIYFIPLTTRLFSVSYS
jgi:hypothetical protein